MTGPGFAVPSPGEGLGFENGGAQLLRDLGGAVFGTVVDDDDFQRGRVLDLEGCEEVPDVLFFVAGWDDDGDGGSVR